MTAVRAGEGGFGPVSSRGVPGKSEVVGIDRCHAILDQHLRVYVQLMARLKSLTWYDYCILDLLLLPRVFDAELTC